MQGSLGAACDTRVTHMSSHGGCVRHAPFIQISGDSSEVAPRDLAGWRGPKVGEGFQLYDNSSALADFTAEEQIVCI